MSAHVHLICGLPGAGKSTHAERLRREVSGLRFSIDDWNARLYFPDRHPAADFEWFYERVQRSCAQMREVAEQALEIGVPVIFDCGLTNVHERAIFGDWAEALGVPVTLHWIDVDAGERWARVVARNAEKGATFRLEVTRDMFDFMERIWEPPSATEAARWRLERIAG